MTVLFLLEGSFDRCGLTTTNPELVGNYDVLRRRMVNFEVKSEEEDGTDNNLLKIYLKTKKWTLYFSFGLQYYWCLFISLSFSSSKDVLRFKYNNLREKDYVFLRLMFLVSNLVRINKIDPNTGTHQANMLVF